MHAGHCPKTQDLGDSDLCNPGLVPKRATEISTRPCAAAWLVVLEAKAHRAERGKTVHPLRTT